MKSSRLTGILEGLAFVIVLAAVAVSYLGGRSLARTWEVPLTPVTLPTDPEAIAEGGRLARITGCRSCHEEGLTGGYAFEDDFLVGRIVVPNLTLVVPEYTDAELARLLRHGVRRDGTSAVVMPSQMFVHLAEADLAAIVAWLRTVPPSGDAHPKRSFGLFGRLGLLTGEYRTSAELVPADATWPNLRPDADAGLELGGYVARIACTECHGQDLGGDGESAPSLAMVSAYTPEQFRHFLRTGEAVGGRRLERMSLLCERRFQYLSDGEIAALYDWLATPGDAPGESADGA